VKVTVVVPPQAAGAPVLLLVNTPLHPPLAVAVASQVLNWVLMVVAQAAVVMLIGHVRTTGGGTVKVA
jgi:hypothetical protein